MIFLRDLESDLYNFDAVECKCVKALFVPLNSLHSLMNDGINYMRNKMMDILRILGLRISERDKELKDFLNSSYCSVRVVGRGPVETDTKEVRQAHEFKKIP